ncbi:DUF6069 family protein [Ornithinicoccus halotolerans]|uniref:DUF6069 family protein n=1 Tax=Ornithinicoccus halotolerans TaxID=1748220 RepID=UPI001294C836|nr:DUF6069 family protein [Ornithinicoccus halotolerans]
MTSTHDNTGTGTIRPTTEPHRITTRHVYLLVALEVAAVLLWAFWRLLGVELEVRRGAGTQQVTLVAVVFATTLAAVASYALLWALRKRELRGWTATAVTVLLVSCAGPLLAATLSAGIALLTFHLLVGVGLIDGIRHLVRAQR